MGLFFKKKKTENGDERYEKVLSKEREARENRIAKLRAREFLNRRTPTISERIGTAIPFILSPTQALQQRDIRRFKLQKTTQRYVAGTPKIRYGKRGRPVGTYDKRYANYGGVYGYRKQLNAKLRIQKLQAMQRATINPQQQAVLDTMAARERARQLDPEQRIIPDTSGKVSLKKYHDEIWEYSNLVD